MVYLTQLPVDVMELIIIMLAISTNGAKEIATISATCKLFNDLAARTHVLREVNFRCLTLTEDFSMHHHPKGLIFVCTQIGNQAARTIFAKALLFSDSWFKYMIAVSNQEALDLRISYSGLLDYHSIVRSFIRYGSCRDIIKMNNRLLNYVTSFVGFKVAHRFGLLEAIHNMRSEIIRIFQEHRSRTPRLTGRAISLPASLRDQVREERKKVLVIFDKVFPSNPV